jgi:2-amino-4-hydroxy-6-hydroxymethyldihydropteridine diphosphokinase
MKAWLGLGSNLQRPVAQLRQAIERLDALDGVEVSRLSSFYRTPPCGDEQQDDFINCVVQIETSLDPLTLLGELHTVEDAMGRRRSGRRWGPRIIDIDLLLYADQQYQSDELEVPHPRMHERAFVLVPLAELDAGLEIPGRGAIGKFLQQLDCSGIICLDDEGLD